MRFDQIEKGKMQMSGNTDRWVHPTKFTGEYPHGWNGYVFLDWSKEGQAYHPADDYNFGYGNEDLGQEVYAAAKGEVVHTSEAQTGYGNIVVIRHPLSAELQRFIKEIYAIETDVLFSLYAHLQDFVVAPGDTVEAGTLIGHVGKSGTTWAHLHFEIYAPIPGTSWRFWPTDWTPEQIKRHYLPPYRFIESVKNMETYAQFLGKPKEYWLQLERERQELLEKLQSKDEEISQLTQDWARRLEEQQKLIQQGKEEITRLKGEIERLQLPMNEQLERLSKRVRELEQENLSLREQLEKASLSSYSVVQLILEIVRRAIAVFVRSRSHP